MAAISGKAMTIGITTLGIAVEADRVVVAANTSVYVKTPTLWA
jgi:hypothetical protein